MSKAATKNTKPRSVPFAVTDPERIPVQRYYDEQFYQAELDHLWPHVWQMACRLEQIPKVGDWVEYSNVGKSVIVVRTDQGIKAFHNACRHRGVPVAGGKGNEYGNCEAQGFTCPFHGWRWNMHGENTFVYGRHLFNEQLLDKAELALRPCRVETWGGCAFINHDDGARSLRECLGPVADRLDAHGASMLRSEWWYATVLPANWKVAMEAFMEGYHVMRTHPQLQQVAPFMYNSIYAGETGSGKPPSGRDRIRQHFRHFELLSEGMAGMCHAKDVDVMRDLLDVDLPEDPEQAEMAWFGIVMQEITKRRRARGEDVPDYLAVTMSHPIHALEFLFPHYFLLPTFSSMSSYRIRPLGPESCLFEIWSLTPFPKGQEPPPPMEPTVLPYDSKEFPAIPQQDYSNIPIQQKGLHAKGFEFMRLSKDKEGLISNYNRIIDGYLAGLPAPKLAAATNLLGGNFDGEIKDLGL